MPSSKSALTWLGALLLFVAVALGADAVFSRMILASTDMNAAKVGRAIHRLDEQEIPIFGSSRARAAYDPEILGPHFYNYGLTLTGLGGSNLLLSYELKKNSRQPVIIDLHPEYIPKIGDVSNYIPYASEPEVEEFLRRAGQWRWYYRVPGLRYFGSYDWYTRDLLGQKIEVTKVTVRGYSRPLNGAPWNKDSFDRFVAKRRGVVLNFGIEPGEKARLIELFRSAPHRRFFVVVSPLHATNFIWTKNEARFRADLADLDRLPNVYVLDYMRTAYPDNYFRDARHLNEKGAAVFSRELRDRIEAEASVE